MSLDSDIFTTDGTGWASAPDDIEEFFRQERQAHCEKILPLLEAQCKSSGSGLHFDMCKIANYLRHTCDVETGVEALYALALSKGYTERKSRYHAEQLRKKWSEDPNAFYVRRPKIEADLDLIWKTVDDSTLTLDEVKAASPVRVDDADDTAADLIVSALFAPEDIICVGKGAEDGYCYRRKDFAPLHRASFLVPSTFREKANTNPCWNGNRDNLRHGEAKTSRVGFMPWLNAILAGMTEAEKRRRFGQTSLTNGR
jgi:hypothetical protein